MAAAAAGGRAADLYARRVASVGEFGMALGRAIMAVEEQKGAFLEAVLEQRK